MGRNKNNRMQEYKNDGYVMNIRNRNNRRSSYSLYMYCLARLYSEKSRTDYLSFDQVNNNLDSDSDFGQSSFDCFPGLDQKFVRIDYPDYNYCYPCCNRLAMQPE